MICKHPQGASENCSSKNAKQEHAIKSTPNPQNKLKYVQAMEFKCGTELEITTQVLKQHKYPQVHRNRVIIACIKSTGLSAFNDLGAQKRGKTQKEVVANNVSSVNLPKRPTTDSPNKYQT